MSDLQGAFRDHLIQIFYATDGETEVLKIMCPKAHVVLKSEISPESLSPDNQVSAVTMGKLLSFDGLKMSSRRSNILTALPARSEAQLWLQYQCCFRHGLGRHTSLFVMSDSPGGLQKSSLSFLIQSRKQHFSQARTEENVSKRNSSGLG